MQAECAVLNHWAGVHHDVETCVKRALGAGLVDHPELEPDGLDAQPFLVGDRFVDDHADPQRVDEAVDDGDDGAVRVALVDSPTTAHVAGVVRTLRITSGSETGFETLPEIVVAMAAQ